LRISECLLKTKELTATCILLKIAPYAIERYIDRNYPGGFICALRDKVDFLMEKASPEQRKILSQLYCEFNMYIVIVMMAIRWYSIVIHIFKI
jgi:hypothetical protein